MARGQSCGLGKRQLATEGDAAQVIALQERHFPNWTAFFEHQLTLPGTVLVARADGQIVTRLARPELCVINTHPVANYDGDWSEANRFYPLHRAELVLWGGPDRRAEFQGGIRVAENDARLVL